MRYSPDAWLGPQAIRRIRHRGQDSVTFGSISLRSNIRSWPEAVHHEWGASETEATMALTYQHMVVLRDHTPEAYWLASLVEHDH